MEREVKIQTLEELVDLVKSLEEDFIILKPKIEPRKGWEDAFKKMHENSDDQLLLNDVFEDEDMSEWS